MFPTVNHVPKCMRFYRAIVAITGRAHFFHDNIYIMLILLLWDLGTVSWITYDHLYIAGEKEREKERERAYIYVYESTYMYACVVKLTNESMILSLEVWLHLFTRYHLIALTRFALNWVDNWLLSWGINISLLCLLWCRFETCHSKVSSPFANFKEGGAFLWLGNFFNLYARNFHIRLYCDQWNLSLIISWMILWHKSFSQKR